MKSIKTTILFLFTCLFSLSAAAADHPCSFVSDTVTGDSGSNKVYNLETKLQVQFVPGYVKVTMPNTYTVEQFPDVTGATAIKIKASQCFQQRYAQVTTSLFFNVTGDSTTVNCHTSGTVVGVSTGSGLNYADGCAGHASAKAKAN